MPVSQSLGRAFNILENFRTVRTPLSATEVRTRFKLPYPYSTIVAILKNLSELGYLSHDEVEKSFFPTPKLHVLGTWVPNALEDRSAMQGLCQNLRKLTGETTALSRTAAMFLNVVYLEGREVSRSHVIQPGMGLPLPVSTVGLVILAQMSTRQAEQIIDGSVRWMPRCRPDIKLDKQEALESIHEARDLGHLVQCDRWEAGVGSIVYPLLNPASGKFYGISVSGPTDRIKRNLSKIAETIEFSRAGHLAGYLRRSGRRCYRRTVTSTDRFQNRSHCPTFPT